MTELNGEIINEAENNSPDEQPQKKKKRKLSRSTKLTIIASVCTALIVGASFTLGFFTHYWSQSDALNTLNWIIQTIEGTYYYDEGSGELKTFTADDYAHGLVNGLLDKYSTFYTKEEYSDVVATNKGNNYGVGISVTSKIDKETDKEITYIYKITGNSPAEHEGLSEYDVLISGEVGGSVTVFETRQQASDFLNARKKGEEFKLTLSREGIGEFTVTLAKRVFVKSFVQYFDNEKALRFENEGSDALEKKFGDNDRLSGLPSDTAYIRLSEFNGGAATQIKDALDYMKERGRTKLIFDLRKNGGGYMNILCDIASRLTYQDGVDKPVISIAKYKNGNRDTFNATGNNFNKDITKIVVLADDNTASASECLIGAMKHYGKAFSMDNLIVEGDKAPAKTYGKGIMQTTYINVLTGEALKLTTAQIYQPDGETTIHGVGLIASAQNSVGRNQAYARALEII